MNSNIISLEIKSQILEELDLRRYSVSEISKIYNVSPTPTMHQKSRLEKAHLVFKDFSIDIEGKVSSEALFGAIKILEISLC
jgi:predicted transcriptional regulator